MLNRDHCRRCRSCRWLLIALSACVVVSMPGGVQAAGANSPGRADGAASDEPRSPPFGLLLPRRRLGPLAIESRARDWTLGVGLAVQMRYEQLTQREAGDWVGKSTAELRRVRPTLGGTLLTRDLGYYLHLSSAPNSLELMDVYVDYRFDCRLDSRLCPLHLRAGQWKIPFTRYRINSFKNLTLVDWSLVTRYFGAERQLGVALHNGYEKPPRWEFELGLFTGANARASHAIGLALLHGEQPVNPSDLTRPVPRPELHPEIVLHLAHNHGGIDTSSDTDVERGPLRLSSGFSAAWDLRPDRYQDLALRLAPEVLLKVRGLSMFGAFYLGFARRGDTLDAQRIALLGGVAQASYLLLDWLELAGRYALVQVDGRVRADARQRADRIVAAARDEERAALAAQYRDAGLTEREQEASLGVNLYLVGRVLKWQNDVSLVVTSRTDGTRHQVRSRSQLQLAF